ncbi:hypothetical protein NC653_000112 [Populus alba x Populus x berolinensis]|uniref:Uncharacterized protein n=1 Tax=Populus alba x Populus x berolinensis TaxID=444605 RepID=A0AAD6RHX0_9ROSI|nr:hypothetical protein NC653_000112 [Populus alba x Populus x berolinensis]
MSNFVLKPQLQFQKSGKLFEKGDNIGKEEATTVKKASSASVATKKNVKGSVFTRLSPIVDTLVDALPAAALPVKVSPVNAPLVDALKLNAPIVPSETCVAQDEQLCS